jgi:hypothetical protein
MDVKQVALSLFELHAHLIEIQMLEAIEARQVVFLRLVGEALDFNR